MPRHLARCLPVLLAGLAVLTTALLAGDPPTTAAPAAPATPQVVPVPRLTAPIVGVSLGGNPATAAGRHALRAFTVSSGARPNLVGWFQSFDTPLAAADLDAVAAAHATPMLTWELWQGADHVGGGALMQGIIDGEHDLRLHRFMVTAARFGGPLVVRLGHEMNGGWYPWAPGQQGTTAAQYVAVWRHIVDLARTDGATNIIWLWAPNVTWGQQVPLASVYPGDAYVNWVGLSGLWNRSYNMAPNPDPFFNPSIAELRRLTAKPLIIAETAATVDGRDQFAAGLVGQARRGTSLGFVWLQQNSLRGDWRLRAAEPALRVSLDAWRTAGAPIARP